MVVLPTSNEKPTLARFNAKSPDINLKKLIATIERDGGIIIENLISRDLAAEIKHDLKPHFDSDVPDKSGLFPTTTQRATGLLGISDACVELACNPLYIEIANAMVSSSHTFWRGDHQETVTCKPIISSTVGFRINPGSGMQMPVLIGAVTALTRTTKENGATVVIPGSHFWGSERRPLDEEAIPAELEPGDALIFLGNLYHGGGANVTRDESRETVGIFLCKPILRPAENQFLKIPLERVRALNPQAQRLLGYGVSKPGVGFLNYQDPMRVLFGVEDEETVDM